MSKSALRERLNSRTLPSPAAVLDGPIAVTSNLGEHEPTGINIDRSLKPQVNSKRSRTTPSPGPARHFSALHLEDEAANRQAELFYLQKQIQQQTPMVFILEDGARVQGVIEWYDRNSIKVRGKSRTLIYKSAIKYLYKAGEVGVATEK